MGSNQKYNFNEPIYCIEEFVPNLGYVPSYYYHYRLPSILRSEFPYTLHCQRILGQYYYDGYIVRQSGIQIINYYLNDCYFVNQNPNLTSYEEKSKQVLSRYDQTTTSNSSQNNAGSSGSSFEKWDDVRAHIDIDTKRSAFEGNAMQSSSNPSSQQKALTHPNSIVHQSSSQPQVDASERAMKHKMNSDPYPIKKSETLQPSHQIQQSLLKHGTEARNNGGNHIKDGSYSDSKANFEKTTFTGKVNIGVPEFDRSTKPNGSSNSPSEKDKHPSKLNSGKLSYTDQRCITNVVDQCNQRNINIPSTAKTTFNQVVSGIGNKQPLEQNLHNRNGHQSSIQTKTNNQEAQKSFYSTQEIFGKNSSDIKSDSLVKERVRTFSSGSSLDETSKNQRFRQTINSRLSAAAIKSGNVENIIDKFGKLNLEDKKEPLTTVGTKTNESISQKQSGNQGDRTGYRNIKNLEGINMKNGSIGKNVCYSDSKAHLQEKSFEKKQEKEIPISQKQSGYQPSVQNKRNQEVKASYISNQENVEENSSGVKSDASIKELTKFFSGSMDESTKKQYHYDANVCSSELPEAINKTKKINKVTGKLNEESSEGTRKQQDIFKEELINYLSTNITQEYKVLKEAGSKMDHSADKIIAHIEETLNLLNQKSKMSSLEEELKKIAKECNHMKGISQIIRKSGLSEIVDLLEMGDKEAIQQYIQDKKNQSEFENRANNNVETTKTDSASTKFGSKSLLRDENIPRKDSEQTQIMKVGLDQRRHREVEKTTPAIEENNQNFYRTTSKHKETTKNFSSSNKFDPKSTFQDQKVSEGNDKPKEQTPALKKPIPASRSKQKEHHDKHEENFEAVQDIFVHQNGSTRNIKTEESVQELEKNKINEENAGAAQSKIDDRDGRKNEEPYQRKIPNQEKLEKDADDAIFGKQMETSNTKMQETIRILQDLGSNEGFDKQRTSNEETKESFDKLVNLQMETQKLMEQVDAFNGTTEDKEYIYLDEMITRVLLKLDNVKVGDNSDLRSKRKECIKYAKKGLNLLKTKAEGIVD